MVDFELRTIRDGDIWDAVGPDGDRHRIGCLARFAAALTRVMLGLVLVRAERDDKQIPLDKWCERAITSADNRQ